MKYLSNLAVIFLAFSIVLTSCSTPENKSTVPNKENLPVQNNKTDNTFKTKSLETKPNEEFRIKILKKSDDSPIEITNKYEKPLVSNIEFGAFGYKPEVKKPFFHKALTKAEIKAKRKAARIKWITWHKERQKKLRQELKSAHKDQRIYQKDVVRLFLSIEDKGSEEYNNLIQEQITLRQELIDQQKDENKALREQYKEEIKDFREILLSTYPRKNNTNVYGSKDSTPCGVTDENCDPFEDAIIDSDFPEDKDYTYYKEDDDTAYKYDNTYVDGNPYSDSYIKEDGNNYSPEVDPTYFDNLQDNTEQNSQGFSAKNFKTLAASCQKVVATNQLINNKVITSISFKDPACKTVFTSIVEVESLPDGCENKNKISFTGKGVSFKAEIPIQLLTKTIVTRVKIKDENGNETLIGSVVTTLPDTGAISINPVERPAGATVQSLTEKNVYSIDNTTGELINFKLKDSSGSVKMEGSCLSMTKGTIDIFKKDLATDNYKLEFYRVSNPNFVVTKKDIKVTNAKVSTFLIDNNVNYDLGSVKMRKGDKLFVDDIRSYNDNVSNIDVNLNSISSSQNFVGKTVINDFICRSQISNSIQKNKVNLFKNLLKELTVNTQKDFYNFTTEQCTTDLVAGAFVDLSPDYNLSENNLFKNEKPLDFTMVFEDINTKEQIFSTIISLERGYIHYITLDLNATYNFYHGDPKDYHTKPIDLLSGRNFTIKIVSGIDYSSKELNPLETFLKNIFSFFNVSLNFGYMVNYENQAYISGTNVSVKLKSCSNPQMPYPQPSSSILPVPLPSYIPTPRPIDNLFYIRSDKTIFSPDFDNINDTIKFYIKVEQGKKWSLNIESQNLLDLSQYLTSQKNELIKKYTGMGTGKEQEVMWDGKGNTGIVLPNFIYKATLESTNKSSNVLINIEKYQDKIKIGFGKDALYSYSPNTGFYITSLLTNDLYYGGYKGVDPILEPNNSDKDIVLSVQGQKPISGSDYIKSISFILYFQDQSGYVWYSPPKSVFRNNLGEIPYDYFPYERKNTKERLVTYVNNYPDSFGNDLRVFAYERKWDGYYKPGSLIGRGTYNLSGKVIIESAIDITVLDEKNLTANRKYEIVEKIPDENNIIDLPVRETDEETQSAIIGKLISSPIPIPSDPSIMFRGNKIDKLKNLQTQYGGNYSSDNWYKVKGQAKIEKNLKTIPNYLKGNNNNIQNAEVHWYEYIRSDGKKFYSRLKLKNWR